MASHHHHHCHPTTTTTSTSSTVCHCCYPNCVPSQPAPIPDFYLPHFHHPSPQTHFYEPHLNGTPIPNPNPLYTNQGLHHHHHQQQRTQYHPHPTGLEKERYFQQLHHSQQQTGELAQDHPIVSSLLGRIAALESSLRSHSSSHSRTLRDAAARTIQTHFRAFLVRRSRTLRQLKDLASIKSILNVLKSSVAGKTYFDPQSLYYKASRLLLKLDSIQGGDPMIRDGRKSISGELCRFLDLLDGFEDDSPEISTRIIKKNVVHRRPGGLCGDRDRGRVRSGDLGSNVRLEDLASRVDALYDRIPKQDDVGDEILECHDIPTIKTISNSTNEAQAKVKKCVRFAEDGKVYKVSGNGYRPVSNEDSSYGDENDSFSAKAEEVGGISFKVSEVDDEDQSQDGESTKSCDGGEGALAYEVRREDGSFMFSAPSPVTMDSRTGSMNRRKILK